MKIKGEEIAIAKMGYWRPSDLAYIARIELQARAWTGTSVILTALLQARERNKGWPRPDASMWQVEMRFDGVGNLRLDSFGGGLVQVMGFDIQSIADRGWEGVAFEISDYEDDRISFFCAEIEILSVEAYEETDLQVDSG